MKIETIGDLIDWTRQLHQTLAQSLGQGIEAQSSERARGLMQYLADHEATLEKTVKEFERQASHKALDTWVYDYMEHRPMQKASLDDNTFADLSVDDISQVVFKWHNEVIDLYRYLQGRADIPEARELIGELLEMETHETQHLASQAGRMNDM
ncbi:ATPase [Mangrovitalea sediminis]|uniref:ATPase n=1 Tax=Mangrovitalea sediminis TaxID=1982043 RepID=UPI000BE569E7|nr:ATPase [Mangrovitalea sediminis]